MCDMLKQTLFSGIYEILAKPFNQRSSSENNQIITTLSNLRFFQRCIADISEREEFIMSISQHLKYKHFPKGTAVCQKGDPEIDFGIVLKGTAIMYEPKSQSEIGQGFVEMNQTYKFEKYKNDLEEMEFVKKLKRWTSLRFDRKHSETLGSTQEIPGTPRKAYATAVDALNEGVEVIMNPKVDVDDSLDDDFDYTFEEKLLLFHNNDTNHVYFSNTRPTYKKYRQFKEGDAITEQSLLTELANHSPILASEDLHIITIPYYDFYSQFKVGSPNEKKMFLASLFPDLLHGIITKLAAAIEERVFLNGDTLYDQGQEAHAIYILRHGRIQLLTFNEDERIDKVPCSATLKEGSKKNFSTMQKLKIGEIAVGGVFGEDEVINRNKRKYFAVCSKTPTLVYVIKKEIYYEVLEKYFPVITDAFKKLMKHKVEWRKDRIKRGMTIMRTVQDNANKTTKTKVIIKEKSSLPTEVEFQTVDLKDSEQEMEIKPPFPGDFEERTSHNIKSKVAIRTCSPSPEINEPSKFNKLQRQYTIKRSGSISDNKISPANRQNESYTIHTKFNITRDEIDSLSPSKINRGSPSPLYHQSSMPNSPTSAKANSSPYFFATQSRNSSPRAKKFLNPVIPDAGVESGLLTPQVPTETRASRTMASFHGRNHSTISIDCSPRDGAKAKTFSDFTKKTSLSPTSSHFYKRIILSQPTNKKKVTETLLTDITPFELKSLSKLKITDNSKDTSSLDFLSFRKNLVALLSPTTTNNTQYTLQQLPDMTKTKSIPQVKMDLDSSMQSPQKMYIINRGLSNPQVVLVDPITSRLVKDKDSRKMNRFTNKF